MPVDSGVASGVSHLSVSAPFAQTDVAGPTVGAADTNFSPS